VAKFETNHKDKGSRTGRFTFCDSNIEDFVTPYLFPVSFLMTGTTARGGGVWKYTLQADHENGLMRQNVPLLSETLHFLDYHLTGRQLQVWREKSIRVRYQTEASVDYRAPIFLDSGGFRLMWRDGLDLSNFGIDLSPDEEAASIFELQSDLGANLIASLDYPLPPGLSVEEQKQRMKRSRNNAVTVGKLIRERENAPFLFMAVHGQTEDDIKGYVKSLFRQIERNSLHNIGFGLAIGSLVPMRSAGKIDQIIKLVWAATRAIPKKYRAEIPIHTFGLAGLLVPFLIYCGTDTFDSSRYMQEARAFRYTDDKTRRSRRILDMRRDELTCNCPTCKRMNLAELQDALVTQSNNKVLSTGHYKSKYYADLALHNLYVDNRIVSTATEAIEAGELQEYLIELTDKFPDIQPALTALAECDRSMRTRLQRAAIQFSTVIPPRRPQKPVQSITFTHTSSHFNINANGYHPDPRRILLILPCSAEKPYSTSTSHRFVDKHLKQVIPNWRNYIHKISLSGLYGPVPVEYEEESEVRSYDFLLKPENKVQIQICTERLITYLQRHQDRYDFCIAYGTSKAYRTVFEKVARQISQLIVLPNPLRARKSAEFYRISNVQSLVTFIAAKIDLTRPSTVD
jgi:7-cyano-7-deazaguanine tRNA-ribosyltransferase